MKYWAGLFLFLSLVLPASALDKADLDFRIRKLTLKLEAMQGKADKRIPAPTLRTAQGVVLLDRTKAGLVFAYQGGGGIALVRDPKTRRWSPPAFLSASEASLGFQIGGQQSFLVILLMNTNAIQALAQGSFKFGGEASGTAGDTTGGAESTVSNTEPLMQVYSDRQGLYGGAAIKGDVLSPDTKADVAYYGQYLTINEILFGGKVKTSDAASELAAKLDKFSK